jgi:HK97 family phage major capsid protein
MSEQVTSPAPAGGAPTIATGRDFDAERKQRNAQLVNLATLAGMPETLADALARDIEPAQYARELQEKKIAQAEKSPSAGVALTARESGDYSFLRALGAQVAMMQGNPRAWEKAGFEREVSHEIGRKLGRGDSGSFFVPLKGLSARAAVTGQVAGTTSLGGAGVQTTVLDMIELLRNNMVVKQAGARVLTGLSANITFPRQITANTLSWTGENPSSGNTNTSMTYDNVTLSPKTAMVSTAASRQSILQFNEDLEALVRADLAEVIGRGLDLAALDGTGANSQPTGVLRQTGLNTVTTTFGSNGAVPDWAAIVQFETALASANAPTGGGWKWITTPGIRGKLKQTLQNTVSGALWCWESGDVMNSYPALVSNQMPSNYTAGTSTTICHGMVLGAWSECLIGEFGGGVEIIVDPYTVASQNMIQYHAIVMADVAVRHGASFAFTKAAKTS